MDDILLRPIIINLFRDNIQNGVNFVYTKMGDGEILCMLCEGQYLQGGNVYSEKLQDALEKAYSFLGTVPDFYLGVWGKGFFEDIVLSDGKVIKKERQQEMFKALKMYYIPVNGLLFIHQPNSPLRQLKEFFETIKNSSRKKVYIGPREVNGIQKFLGIDEYCDIPTQDAFGQYDEILKYLLGEDSVEDNTIFMFSAGMMAKCLIHRLVEKNRHITCIDFGSGFDVLSSGWHTRTNQEKREKLLEYYNL